MKKYGDYILEYVKTKYQIGAVCENTHYTDINYYNLLLKKFPGIMEKAPEDITTNDVNTIISSGKSKSAQKKYKTLLKFGLNYALDDKAISENIFITKNYKIVHTKDTTPYCKKASSLTLKEHEKFIKCLEKEPDSNIYKWVWLIELNTGMRIGEILALYKNDINFSNQTITIHRTVSRRYTGEQYVHDTAKTNSGNRTIFLNESTNYIFHAILQNSDKQSPFLLNHEKITIVNSNNRLKRFMARNKILEKDKKFTQHMLRHTYATRLIEAGVPAIVVQKNLGHSSIRVTLDTYTDVFNDYQNSYNKQILDYQKQHNILYNSVANTNLIAISDLRTIEKQVNTSRIDDKLKQLLTNDIVKILSIYKNDNNNSTMK